MKVTKEKKAIKCVKFIDALIDIGILISLLIFLLFAAYALWDTKQLSKAAAASQFESYKPVADDSKSFEELKVINPDTFGWITVYGTKIDYPVVQTKDNEKYVDTNIFGEYSLVGTIFLDYRNKNDFSDFNSIIYGHHMDEPAMFGEIGKFDDYEFFNDHKYGSLFYDGREHGLEFFAYIEEDAYNFSIFTPALEGAENRDKYLQDIIKYAMYTRPVEVSAEDHIVLLYTCTTQITNGRDVLVAKLSDGTFENTFANEVEEESKYKIDSRTLKEIFGEKCFLIIPEIVLGTMLLILVINYRKRYRKIKKLKEEFEKDYESEQNKTKE